LATSKGKIVRLPGLAVELVALRPDVTVATTTNGACR